VKRELGLPYRHPASPSLFFVPLLGEERRPCRFSEAVRGASAILGYRPCAAATRIVEHAVRRRKPFAILPCCAYRVDGAACPSLADFAHRLQRKDPAIRRTVVGGSLVLFATFDEPPAPPAGDGAIRPAGD
jgi:hypothetical protein